MFFSRKLEAFMAVVEYGSLSKAAKVMNRTTPPVAKSIKDFEISLGKRLFKRKKFGMSLTREGMELYNDLKDLYMQEKEITKKHISGTICNKVNIFYDWGKSKYIAALYRTAFKAGIQINIFRFHYDCIDEINDFEGNTLILSSEQVISERFTLLRHLPQGQIGICCRRSLFQDCDNNLQTLLSSCVWLCEPLLYESPLLKTLLLQLGEQSKHEHVHLIDNVNSYLHLLIDGDYLCFIDEHPKTLPYSDELIFLPLSQSEAENHCYLYKSKSHASVLNKIMDCIENMK